MSSQELADERADFATHSVTVFEGPVTSITNDTFEFYGHRVVRQVVRHPGAVAVLALRGAAAQQEILMVRQYRHPVRRLLWELPAGLCDAPGESREACARRELLEETGHRASALEQLVTTATSPGGSDELLTLFLTYDPVPDAEAYGTQEPEERHMQAAWFPLAQAVEAVRSGKILNGIAQLGISLAALRVRHGVAR